MGAVKLKVKGILLQRTSQQNQFVPISGLTVIIKDEDRKKLKTNVNNFVFTINNLKLDLCEYSSVIDINIYNDKTKFFNSDKAKEILKERYHRLKHLENALSSTFIVSNTRLDSDNSIIYLTTYYVAPTNVNIKCNNDCEIIVYTSNKLDRFDSKDSLQLSGNSGKKNYEKISKELLVKMDNIKLAYDWINNLNKQVYDTGDYSTVIKEGQRIGDFINILNDNYAWYIKARACFNSLNSINIEAQNHGENSAINYIKENSVNIDYLNNLYKGFCYIDEGYVWKKKKIKDWQEVTFVEQAWHSAVTIVLAPARLGILTMIRLNVFNVRTGLKKLKEQNYNTYDVKFRTLFYNLGGNRTKLDEAVDGIKKAEGDTIPELTEKEINQFADAIQSNPEAVKSFAESIEKTTKEGVLVMPQYVGGIIAGAISLIQPQTAPYATVIGGTYELIAKTINSMKLKIGKNNNELTQTGKNNNELTQNKTSNETVKNEKLSKDDKVVNENMKIMIISVAVIALLASAYVISTKKNK